MSPHKTMYVEITVRYPKITINGVTIKAWLLGFNDTLMNAKLSRTVTLSEKAFFCFLCYTLVRRELKGQVYNIFILMKQSV